MILTSAILLLLSSHVLSDSHQEYDRLSNQLAQEVEWIDAQGIQQISKARAVEKLSEFARSSTTEISQKHFSSWKNGKCYWIFDLETDTQGHRVFFYCTKDKRGHERVTKIKVS